MKLLCLNLIFFILNKKKNVASFIEQKDGQMFHILKKKAKYRI